MSIDGAMTTATPGWLARVGTIPDPSVAGAMLQLRRSWPRNADHVLLEYVDAATRQRVVVGQWMADRDRLERVAAAMVVADGPDAAVLLTPYGVVVHRHGADRRLAALGALVDDPAATLVVHRPERRAVVRIDTGDGSAPRWVKIVRNDRVAQLRQRAGHLAGLTGVPRLLRLDHDRGLTVWSHQPGVALGGLLDDDAAAAALTGTGALLRRFHRVAAPRDPALLHSAADELVTVTTWLGHLAAFDPATHRTAQPLLGPVGDALGALPARDRGHATVHRDVHDGQVLVEGSRVALLDPDTVAAGDPELDLGNLCAHLHLAHLQGRSTRISGQGPFDLVLDAYGRDGVDRHRLGAYTAAALLRLVGVHALRPQTRPAVPGLLEAAQRMLSGARTAHCP